MTETWTDYDDTDPLWWFYSLLFIGGSKDLITSPTAYAKAQGAYTISDYHDSEGKESSDWWLRSPGDDSDNASCVTGLGGVYAGYYVDHDIVSVRPALWVNLAS